MEKRSPESDAETLSIFAEYVGQHTKRAAKISSGGSTPLILTISSVLVEKRELTEIL